MSIDWEVREFAVLKTGHGQHSSKFVICVVLFVIRVVLLLIVMFYVFFMCKCELSPGVNLIAVGKYIYIYIYLNCSRSW
jgi:hypothetical protein